ncbi:heme oxygenase [Herbihabitans rhizosphaerae]|uniref:Heme oxygenase n=1 Tax=Herbihabitans rhizosphaerae TaxID=1872711 RepID=A0A4Q7KD58_9PSEU|nr:biliverdin-producing heme oxygenase [Herbihabitans rhizosphaerae]RZS31134.1 heme oxygenase [Herbihabitans rhizosphaerae]
MAGLAERLRAETRAEHERTEQSPFVMSLLDGQLDRGCYARLLGQSWLFYQVLEEAAEAWRSDPVTGAFVFDGLHRGAALEADLRWLHGEAWRDAVVPLPATRRYVDRLRAVCFDSPTAFVAHHYTRYLGDLSGGQIIRRRLTSIYGLTTDGVRFYVFDEVPKPKRFKDAYRELLDQAPWTAEDHDDVVAEANEAFRLNRAVFEDLADASGLAA